MAADIKDAGPLAHVGRYGVPWHGRIEGGTLYTGKYDALGEVTRPWPQPVYSDCWIVRRSGLPDPYDGAAQDKADDALEGKELTNWAILQRPGLVHGKNICAPGYAFAWLWFDEDGIPWAVSFRILSGTAGGNGYRFDSEMVLRLLFRRFGELIQFDPARTAEQHTADITLAPDALGQAVPYITADELAGFFALLDVKPDGSQVILSVKSAWAPLGFATVSLSTAGDGSKQATFSLLANRAQTLGARTKSGSSRSARISTASCVLSGDPPAYASASFQHINEHSYVDSYAGRVVGYHYNASLVPIPATLSLTLTSVYSSDGNETSDSTPSWSGSYNTTSSDDWTFSFVLDGATLSVSASTVVSGNGSGSLVDGLYVCSSTWSKTHASSATPTRILSGENTSCPTATGASLCNQDYDITTPVTQPTETESAIAMYQLALRHEAYPFHFTLTSPVVPLHEMLIGDGFYPETWRVWNSVGCVGIGVADMTHRAAYDGYYNIRPAPARALTYTTNPVTFT